MPVRKSDIQSALATKPQAPRAASQPNGHVWLIGCGPGDPELLTLKAARIISEADVVIYDRLVDPQILEFANTDAEKIYVGKEGFGPSTPQDEINRLLLEHARNGQRVARLKGGDVFVFARASEELSNLQDAGIKVTVVPGITAAHACAASVQLPLTQRQLIQQITLVTGTSADGELNLDWPTLAKPGQASAIYMGVTRASVLQRRLLLAGANPETPIVVVENGTRAEERTITTKLEYLSEAVSESGINGPAIIFVGLDWALAGLQKPSGIETYPTPSSDTVFETRPANIDETTRCSEPVLADTAEHDAQTQQASNIDLRRHG